MFYTQLAERTIVFVIGICLGKPGEQYLFNTLRYDMKLKKNQGQESIDNLGAMFVFLLCKFLCSTLQYKISLNQFNLSFVE